MSTQMREEIEIEQIRQQINESVASVEKMKAETSKTLSESKWYPLIIGCTATLAIVAIVKLFL